MSPPLNGRIIGVGSPFGADRAGWEAVDYLQTTGFPERYPQLDWQTLDRPGPRLIEWFAGRDLVVIIDALLGGAPGEARVVDTTELADHEAGLSSHGFGVAAALAMAEALGDLPQRLVIVGIEVGDGQSELSRDYQPVAEQLETVLSGSGFTAR